LFTFKTREIVILFSSMYYFTASKSWNLVM